MEEFEDFIFELFNGNYYKKFSRFKDFLKILQKFLFKTPFFWGVDIFFPLFEIFLLTLFFTTFFSHIHLIYNYYTIWKKIELEIDKNWN